MKYCTKCGFGMDDNMKFCSRCGTKLYEAGANPESISFANGNEAYAAVNAVTEQPVKKKKKTPLIVGLVIAALVLIAVIVMAVTGVFGEKADKEFLADMEALALEKINESDDDLDDGDKRELVSSELAVLEKYEDADFKDDELSDLVDKYIAGLELQENSIDYDSDYLKQHDWQTGLIKEYEVLNALYENYDFMTDNEAFVSTFVNGLEAEKYILEAYANIKADIANQTGEEELGDVDESDIMHIQLKNNTPYTFTLKFDVKYCGENGTSIVATESAIVEDIAPNETYTVSVYVPESVPMEFNYYWETSYYDVK